MLVADRVGDGVDDGGGRSDRAGFAAALDAERVRRAGRHRRADVEGRQVVGARHAVVHVARRDELPVLVVDGAFEQRLADTLRDAAMHLALDDHRVDDDAEIVDRRPAIDLRDAGFRIDLDLADMHAGREGEIGRIVEGALLQARLELLAGEFMRDIGLQRDRAEIGRLVGALDGELAVLELDVALGGLEHMAGDLLGLGSILSSALKIADMPTAPEREP